MVENQNETARQGPDEGAIARARDAAVECVAAVISFYDAALAWRRSYLQHNVKWFKHNPVDYRPHVAWLYRALKEGWEPIGKVSASLVTSFTRGDSPYTAKAWELNTPRLVTLR